MSRAAIASKLNVVANVALIVASIVVAVVTIARFLDARGQAPPPQGYRTGESVVLSSVDFSRSSGTLLLVVRSTCRFCTDSIPFYRRIAETRDRYRSDVRLIAVSTEAAEVTRSYLNRHDFAPDEVIRMDPGALRVFGTPTLILADQAGLVVVEKRGMLPPDDELSVLEAIFGRLGDGSNLIGRR